MLLIYLKENGNIVGTNSSATATFENTYPTAPEEFKQKYGGLAVEYNPDYDKNRTWYKVVNEEVVKLDSPFVNENKRPKIPKIPDPRDQRIAELENAVMLLINGGTVSEGLSPMDSIKSFNESIQIEDTNIKGV